MKRHKIVIINGTNYRSSSNRIIETERYKECQKNQAANIGGFAVDGCQEFGAAGTEGTAVALICVACGCHRDFHRRVVVSQVVGDSSSTS